MSAASTSPSSASLQPVPSRAGRGRRWSALTQAPWGYLVPAVAVLGALSIYPLIQLVRMALSDVGPTTVVGPWEFTGLTNLKDVWNDRLFRESFRATAYFTVVLLIIDLVIGYIAAAMLSSTSSRAASLTLRVMVFVWALPPLVSGSVWKFLLAGNGLVNEILGLVGIGPVDWLSSPDLALLSVSLVAAWASLPFSILIIHGGMLALPRDVLEAAQLDGAGFLKASRFVILPLMKPTLTVLTVLIILYAFRSFDFVYVMTLGGPGTETTTLPYLAYDTAFKTFEFGTAAAIAVISMLVIVVVSIPYVISVRREAAL
ncbi:MAG: hypothetical protein CL424_16940 [Acidimicrobiaceae bacterium]|nr:hypothetical protein [Acidimicrobiaceae bacterium]